MVTTRGVKKKEEPKQTIRQKPKKVSRKELAAKAKKKMQQPKTSPKKKQPQKPLPNKKQTPKPKSKKKQPAKHSTNKKLTPKPSTKKKEPVRPAPKQRVAGRPAPKKREEPVLPAPKKRVPPKEVAKKKKKAPVKPKVKSDGGRKNRGLQQRIYLLGCKSKKTDDGQDWEIKVCGASGNHYFIRLNDTFTCSCPDHKMRKLTCKHMYFMLQKVCCFPENKKFNPGTITKKQREEIYAALLIKFTPEGERVKVVVDKFDPDECCCICYEELGVEEDIVACDTICKNCFHAGCIEMWRKASSNCPMCRTDPLVCQPVDTKNFEKEDQKKEAEEINEEPKDEAKDENNMGEAEEGEEENEDEVEAEEEEQPKKGKKKKEPARPKV